VKSKTTATTALLIFGFVAAANGITATLPVTTCESLTSVDLTRIGGDGSRVVSAKATDHKGVAVCSVEGVLAPAIGFQVVLPTATWQQRYLQTGCGGLCGRISLNVSAADGCLPLTEGQFVIASSDMGHRGPGGVFGEDPQKRIDFAHRGMHLTAVAAKALINEYYGQAPTYSYFVGCSDGGREGLMEAQRYPDDFDGIVAGAPAMHFSVQNSFYHAWQARSNSDANGEAILRAERLPLLNTAVIAACDDLDGISDGLITDPRACNFDPASIRCDDDAVPAGCLTSAEVDAATNLYRGPHDQDTGVPLTLGGPQPGSELSWPGVFVPRPGEERIFSTVIANDALGNLIYETNPAAPYSIEQLSFDLAAFDEIRPLNGLYSSSNPDLRAFDAAGGKLILWHGWSDPHISPINTIAYFETVEMLLGAETTSRLARLYLLPGVYHCSGGTGPSRIDLLSAVMAWVENDVAPGAIESRDENGRRSLPVYPYPFVASHTGDGPAPGARGPATYEWAGKEFLMPGQQLDCQVDQDALDCGVLEAGD